jgi:ankyrin repeat protein
LILTLLAVGTIAEGADAPLVDAVKRGDQAAVRALIQQRADVNRPEVDGTTPLHWAAHENLVEVANLLIRAGAKATTPNRYGVLPLSLACVNGNAAMIQRLLDAGADANAPGAKGETPLMTAARSGSVAAVNVLLDHGASVNAKESWRGQTALMWAAAEGHGPVVKVLVARGADVLLRSKIGFTALLFAARDGRIDSVNTLLDAGSSLNESLPAEARKTAGGVEIPAEQPETGLNAFLLAAGNAHYELAALLLDRGANPNAAPRGWHALHQLSWVRKAGIAGSNNPSPEGSGNMNSLEFARALVAHGADPNARVTKRPPAGVTRLNMIGGTPFLLAARTADAEYMKLLAELGADPLLPNADNTTPLMVAAGVGTYAPGEDPGTEREVLEAVKLALKLGGNIKAVDDNGETAMHGAASKHVPSVVQFLADAGATVESWNFKNTEGYTPLEITQGIQRSMSIIRSAPTEAAIKQVMRRAGVPTAAARP